MLKICLDKSLLIHEEFQEEDIVAIVDECDRSTKVGFLPETEASYLGLILHIIDLTSLNSTDNSHTIDALIDKVIIIFVIVKLCPEKIKCCNIN